MELWQFFADSMAALVAMMQEYSSFMQVRCGRREGGEVREGCAEGRDGGREGAGEHERGEGRR